MKIVAHTSGAVAGRQAAFEELRSELVHHAMAEEKTLYEAMKESTSDTVGETASHSVKEHRELEELIKQLSHMGYDSPSWLDVFKRLQDRVEHHLREEEQEAFMSARNAISETQSAKLAARYTVLRTQLRRDPAVNFADSAQGTFTNTLETYTKAEVESRARDLGVFASGDTKSEMISKIRFASGSAEMVQA